MAFCMHLIILKLAKILEAANKIPQFKLSAKPLFQVSLVFYSESVQVVE
jgi:hypothetical protein